MSNWALRREASSREIVSNFQLLPLILVFPINLVKKVPHAISVFFLFSLRSLGLLYRNTSNTIADQVISYVIRLPEVV